MARDRVYMPQSTAGLIRYFDEGKETVKIRPEHVVVVSVVFIALELALKFGVFG